MITNNKLSWAFLLCSKSCKKFFELWVDFYIDNDYHYQYKVVDTHNHPYKNNMDVINMPLLFSIFIQSRDSSPKSYGFVVFTRTSSSLEYIYSVSNKIKKTYMIIEGTTAYAKTIHYLHFTTPLADTITYFCRSHTLYTIDDKTENGYAKIMGRPCFLYKKFYHQ